MNTALMFSSATDLCSTPQDYFDKLDAEFYFTLDVCATDENAKCVCYYTKEIDGLEQSWQVAEGSIWMNPPYGREIPKWIACAHKASLDGATVVCLLPARTDTAAWHNYIWDENTNDWRSGVEGRFIRGRLKFGGLKNSAPFPSVVIIFRPEAKQKVEEVCK